MRSAFLDLFEQKISDYSRVICHASGINDPIPVEWNQYVTQSPIALEVIPDVLYDTLTYTSAATTELIFFNQTNVKKDISNMIQPGMLPNPESFLVQAPRIYFKWLPTISTTTLVANVINDIALLVNTSVCTLTFGNKKYGPYPTWLFSAGAGPDMRITSNSALAAAAYAGYAQLGGSIYGIFPNLMIAPLQNFSLSMAWPSGAVTLGAGNPAIEVLYDGQRARSVQ